MSLKYTLHVSCAAGGCSKTQGMAAECSAVSKGARCNYQGRHNSSRVQDWETIQWTQCTGTNNVLTEPCTCCLLHSDAARSERPTMLHSRLPHSSMQSKANLSLQANAASWTWLCMTSGLPWPRCCSCLQTLLPSCPMSEWNAVKSHPRGPVSKPRWCPHTVAGIPVPAVDARTLWSSH